VSATKYLKMLQTEFDDIFGVVKCGPMSGKDHRLDFAGDPDLDWVQVLFQCILA